jgi:hypothetical protein
MSSSISSSSSSSSLLAPSSSSSSSSSHMTTPRFNIPRLTAKNYPEWKHHIDAALYLQQLKKYVETDIKFEDISSNGPEAVLYVSAFTLLNNNISLEVRENLGVIEQYSPFHLYNAVVKFFEPKTAASRLHNRRKFFRYTCSDPRDVTRFCTIIEQMCAKSNTISLFTDEVIQNIVDPNGKQSAQELHVERLKIQKVISYIEDIDKMAVLLGGVPDLFETTVTIIESDPTMKYAKCKDMIIAFAQRYLQENGDPSDRQTSISLISTSSSSASAGQASYQTASPAQNANSSVNPSTQCDFCGKMGHTSKMCWSAHPELFPHGRGNRGKRGAGRGSRGGNQRGNQGGANRGNQQNSSGSNGFNIANCFLNEIEIENDEEDDVLVFSEQMNGITASSTQSARYVCIDSGASKNMTGEYTDDLMSEKKVLDKPVVINFPNGAKAVAKTAGLLKFETSSVTNGSEITFKDVIIAKDMKNTVVSVAQVCDSGALVLFTKTEGLILRKSSKDNIYVVAKFPRVKNLYKLDMDEMKDTRIDVSSNLMEAAEVNMNELEELLAKPMEINPLTRLHYDLGHVHERAIKEAIKSEAYRNIPKEKAKEMLKMSVGKCTMCEIGKMTMKSRPMVSENHAEDVLERICADTSGMKAIATPSGYKGYSVITDEYSGYIDVKLIRHKNEVQRHILEFKAMWENILEKKIKYLRSDNAKEYVEKKDFIKQLALDGIKHEKCCEYVHAQNGQAEREVGILAAMCRTNLEQAGAPKWLWGECIQHCATQRILQPRKRLDYRTPFEIWHNRAPDLRMLKPWGCLAIAHVPEERRSKIDPRGERCIYIGIDKLKKGHRLLRLSDRKVIVTPNATFHEQIFPYKMKSIADYIVSKFVPGGIPELSLATQKEEEETTDTEDEDVPYVRSHNLRSTNPAIVIPRTQSATTANQVQDPYPATITRSDTPPIILDDIRQTNPTRNTTFVTSGSKASHNDDMIRKQMTGFNPNQKRGGRRESVSNIDVVKFSENYYDALSAEVEEIPEGEFEEAECFLMKDGPFGYKEAFSSPNGANYDKAAERELEAFRANEVYDLVPQSQVPIGEKIFRPRWVFGQKWDETFKARLTVDGSRQKKGVHFLESRSDTLSLPLLRFMLCLIMVANLIPYQFDVPNAFLQSPMDTAVYLSQPEGFVDKKHPDWVWRLKKCVYGLKQASLQWRSTFHDFITNTLGFKEIGYNTSVYILNNENGLLAYILVYVDDFIMACNDDEAMHFMVEKLIEKFRVKSLGEVKKYLGMEFTRVGNRMMVNQREYIEKMIEDLNMKDLSPIDVPQPDGLLVPQPADLKISFEKYSSVIGRLIWLSVCTRPDIAFYVSYYATFMSDPTENAWRHVIQIVRYLNGTKHLGIIINKNGDATVIINFADAGHANEFLQRRSVSGNIFLFTGTPIMWASKKIHSVIKSAMEAEYIAMSDAAYDGKYMLMICKYVTPHIKHIDMFVDNKAAKSIAEGTGQVRKVKHLETHFHIVRQMVLEQQIRLEWISTKLNISDIFTKHIGNKKMFMELRDKILEALVVRGGV